MKSFDFGYPDTLLSKSLYSEIPEQPELAPRHFFLLKASVVFVFFSPKYTFSSFQTTAQQLI